MLKMRHLLKIVSLSLLFIGISACGPTAPTCLSGAPQAIFSKDMQGVQNHTFEIKKRSSIERVSLPQLAMEVEILQSGCKQIEQEFRFHLDGTVKDAKQAPDCALLVANIFEMIAEIDAQRLDGMLQWAQAVGSKAKEFNYGDPIPLGGNFYATLAQLPSETTTLITLNIIQKPE